MKRMIEVPLESGGSVLMEVELDEDEQEGMVPAARDDQVAVEAEQTFEKALEQIKPVADTVISKLRDISAKPDGIEVSFGLKMSAKAGAFIASASTEANFTVLLRWNCE